MQQEGTDWPKVAFWIAVLIGTALIFTGVYRLGADLAEARVHKPPLVHTYATCYEEGGTTSSGTQTNHRTAASNLLAPGTKVRLVGQQTGPNGIRRYVIRDTGSALLDDGHLDLFSPNGGCQAYGNPTIKYKRGWGVR